MFVLGAFALFAQDSLQIAKDTNVVSQAIIPISTDTIATKPVMGTDSTAILNNIPTPPLTIPEIAPLKQQSYQVPTVNPQDADTTLNFVNVETITYAQFLGQFWDELVVTGEKALNKHIDYYYLRLRLGVAYFQLQKFRAAEQQFNKAMQFNSEDPFLKEYLYFTYLKNAHYEQALKLSASFDNTLKTRTVGTDMPISLLYAESGGKISNNDQIFSNAFYLQAGIGHRLTKYLNITHAYTNYNQQAFYGKVTQKQYYLGAKIPIKKTWLINPAFHLVTFDVASPPSTKFPYYKTPTKTVNGIVAAINLQKTFTYFDIAAGYAYATLNDSIQQQENIQMNIYPWANNKFSIGANVTIQQRNGINKNTFGYNFNTTYAPHWKFKISASYFMGDLKNNTEDNGFVVNNSYYVTTNRITLTPQIAITKKIDAYMMYQYENKALYNYTLQYNNFFVGLKYKF
jgi:hypothetical protein